MGICPSSPVFYRRHYGEGVAELVYYYGNGSGLEIIDMLMAVCCVASVVWALYARQQFKNFRRQAPGIYIGYLCFNAATTIGYLIAVSAITQEFLLSTAYDCEALCRIALVVSFGVTVQPRTLHLLQSP